MILMEKKNRYIMNLGLAFDEDRVMKKLSQMAKEGWILEEMTLFRYRLVKEQPKEIVYSMDYKKLGENSDEYFELFQNSGWKHMCSYGDYYHFFSAPPETVSIYTEKENYLSKYKNSKDGCKKTAVISILMLSLLVIIEFVVGSRIEGKIIKNIMGILSIILVAIIVPSLMVSISYSLKEKRILKKNSKIN
ncbi:MAG: hypothetical protein ACI8WT_001523 [Clostridium sp.]|jgi:hypothetical protein